MTTPIEPTSEHGFNRNYLIGGVVAGAAAVAGIAAIQYTQKAQSPTQALFAFQEQHPDYNVGNYGETQTYDDYSIIVYDNAADFRVNEQDFWLTGPAFDVWKDDPALRTQLGPLNKDFQELKSGVLRWEFESGLIMVGLEGNTFATVDQTPQPHKYISTDTLGL